MDTRLQKSRYAVNPWLAVLLVGGGLYLLSKYAAPEALADTDVELPETPHIGQTTFLLAPPAVISLPSQIPAPRVKPSVPTAMERIESWGPTTHLAETAPVAVSPPVVISLPWVDVYRRVDPLPPVALPVEAPVAIPIAPVVISLPLRTDAGITTPVPVVTPLEAPLVIPIAPVVISPVVTPVVIAITPVVISPVVTPVPVVQRVVVVSLPAWIPLPLDTAFVKYKRA